MSSTELTILRTPAGLWIVALHGICHPGIQEIGYMAKGCSSSSFFLFFLACSTARNTLQIRLRHKQSVHVPKPAETGTYVTHPMYLKTRKSVHVPKSGKIGTCT